MYVQLPPEDIMPGEEQMVGRLSLCLYGTRDAAMQWQECVAEHLTKIGFERSAAFPSLYRHAERDLCTLIHGDDYVSSGEQHQVKWWKDELEMVFDIKIELVGYDDPEVKSEGKILNRLIAVDSRGWSLEADPRHVELLVEELKVEKGLATPGVEDREEEDDSELKAEEASRYRSLVARANYLAIDRPDICFSVKELCRSMPTPTRSSWTRLVRVVKYLQRNPRFVLKYDFQEAVNELDVYSDANWAGCKATRKSTSGGTIMRGGHLLKNWSKNQSVIALSSAESEFHAAIKTAVEGLRMISMAQSVGDQYKARMHADASAALGVIRSKGVGRIRHLHTGCLWIQEQALS